MHRLATALLFLSAAVPAQVSLTSPKGYETKSGGGSYSIGTNQSPFFSTILLGSQIDNTQRGSARAIRALHFRQAKDQIGAAATNMTVNLRVGHGDYSKVTGSSQMVDDVLVGAWSTVLSNTAIRFPDWSKPSSSNPAPWSIRLPFASNFAYDGNNALMYQVAAQATTGALYRVDSIQGDIAFAKGATYGAGCGSFTTETVLSVSAQTKRVGFYAIAYPADLGQRPIAFVGVRQQNVSFGACAPLLCTQEVALTMNRVLLGSRLAHVTGSFSMPFDSSLVGNLEVFTQTWRRDSSQTYGIIGSSGYRSGKYPALPMPTLQSGYSSSASIGGFRGFPTTVSFGKGSAMIAGIE